MHAISQLIDIATELVEAEGRVFRAATMRVAHACALIAIAVILGSAGVGLMLLAVFIRIELSAGPFVACLVTSIVAFLAAALMLFSARRFTVRRK